MSNFRVRIVWTRTSLSWLSALMFPQRKPEEKKKIIILSCPVNVCKIKVVVQVDLGFFVGVKSTYLMNLGLHTCLILHSWCKRWMSRGITAQSQGTLLLICFMKLNWWHLSPAVYNRRFFPTRSILEPEGDNSLRYSIKLLFQTGKRVCDKKTSDKKKNKKNSQEQIFVYIVSHTLSEVRYECWIRRAHRFPCCIALRTICSPGWPHAPVSAGCDAGSDLVRDSLVASERHHKQ